MFLLWTNDEEKTDHLAGVLTNAYNGNCCRQSPQIMPLPATLTVLHQEPQPRIGSTMFMVWVSSWNKCDSPRHHKVNRPHGHANFSTSSHLSHRFSFMTRHQGTSANDRFHAQRSTQKAHVPHNTTLRWQSSPNPSGQSTLLEESSLGNRKPSVQSTDVPPWRW